MRFRFQKLPPSLVYAIQAGRWSVRRDEAMRNARSCQYADLKAELVTNARDCHHRFLKSVRWAKEASRTEKEYFRVTTEVDNAI
jgi:hypothetical protein